MLSKHCDDLKKIYRFYARGTGGHSATLMSASEYLKFCTDVQANANAPQRATCNLQQSHMLQVLTKNVSKEKVRQTTFNAHQTTRSVQHATHTVQRAAHTRNTVLRFTCCTSHPPMRASPSSRRATRARM